MTAKQSPAPAGARGITRARSDYAQHPVGSNDLSAKERALIGSLLEANGVLPATLARLVEHSPQSWSDARCGAIGAAIRALRREGRPVHPTAVISRLNGDNTGAALLLGSLLGEALPLDLAEIEAGPLWKSYQIRLARSVFGDSFTELGASPDKAASIIRHALRALESLVIEAGSDDWSSLIEDAADILDEDLPPVVEIIEGIVAEQCKLVIGSGSKSFKTWLSIDLALSLSQGVPFLERKTTRVRVLYVNLELRPRTFKRRVQAVAMAKSVVPDREWFRHLPLRGKLAGLTVQAIVNRIIALAKRFSSRVVIVDPVYKLNVEGDENSSRDQTCLFNQLDRITTEAECTLILNDHFGKGNQSEKDPLDAIRGSSAKGGDVDAAMILRKHEVEGCFRVDIVHRELAPVEPFCIGWKYPLMHLRPDLDAAAMKPLKAGRRKAHDPRELLAVIANNTAENPVTISAWAEAAGVKRQTLTEYLPAMRSRGWVATKGEGKAARQFCTEKGREVAQKRLGEE